MIPEELWSSVPIVSQKPGETGSWWQRRNLATVTVAAEYGKKQDSELPSEIGNSRAFPRVPFILAATGR